MSNRAGDAADAALTVVIPTYNRPDQLKACLDGLKGQRRRPNAVVVVNDGGPGPDRIIELFEDSLAISLIQSPGRGPVEARNAALLQVRTPYVGFLDDDSVPEESWSAACVDLFDRFPMVTAQLGRILWRERAERLSGRRRFLPQLRQKIYDSRHVRFTDELFCRQLSEAMERPLPDGLPGLGTHLSAGNCAIRREFLERHGPFNTLYRTLSDREMAYRILDAKGLIAYNPDMRVEHDHDPSIARGLKRCYRTAAYQKLLQRQYSTAGGRRRILQRFVEIQGPLTVLERVYLAAHRAVDWWAMRFTSRPCRDPLVVSRPVNNTARSPRSRRP